MERTERTKRMERKKRTEQNGTEQNGMNRTEQNGTNATEWNSRDGCRKELNDTLKFDDPKCCVMFIRLSFIRYIVQQLHYIIPPNL